LSSFLRVLDLFINTDHPASYKAAGHRSRYFGRLHCSPRHLLLHMIPQIARAINT